jgi:hypothetical protein
MPRRRIRSARPTARRSRRSLSTPGRACRFPRCSWPSSGASVETRQDGGFVLPDILPGEIHLSVSAVGYGLVQRTLHLARGGTADLTIPLSEGSATYTETVTVAADRFERPEPVPSQQTERSNHAEVSLEHCLSPSLRAQVALYHRDDEDVIRRPQADTRLVAGRVLRGSTTARFATRLDGFA